MEAVEVNIYDLVSTMHAVDDADLLTPRTMERIVQLVLVAVREREGHQERIRREQQVMGGVRDLLGDNQA